jgi:ArsR family transcriptional regulator, arsenate/arsenite/antimonite-responsive transcriptional repressor
VNGEYAIEPSLEWASSARFFAALGDTTRQQILLLFARHTEMCVNEIARRFKLSRPAISHHLKVLQRAGLLQSEKRGKEVFYRPDFAYCAEVLETMRHCIERCTPQIEPPAAAPYSPHSSPNVD